MLITAGPTHEPIDAVRYLGNRSSGRMGIALAEAALARGLDVTLLLGPIATDPPVHSHLVTRRFRTTADLRALLAELWPDHDVLIMAAAVADFRPADPAGEQSKMSRGSGPVTLSLVPTPDLLAEAAAAARTDQRTIGFALEPPEGLAAAAARKLAAKGIDAIVANPLATMDDPSISAFVLLADGRRLEPPDIRCDKATFASWLLDNVVLKADS